MNIYTRNTPRQYLRNGDLNVFGGVVAGYYNYGISGMSGGYLPALPLEDGGYLVEDFVTFSQKIIANALELKTDLTVNNKLNVYGDTNLKNTTIDGDINITGKILVNGEEFKGEGFVDLYNDQIISGYKQWVDNATFNNDVYVNGCIYSKNYALYNNSTGKYVNLNDMYLPKTQAFKTINGESILGTGNISVSGGGGEIIGDNFNIQLNDVWEDDILSYDSEQDKWANKHTGKVVVYETSSGNYDNFKSSNHQLVKDHLYLSNIPYTPLEEVPGIKQYQYIEPNESFGGHIYAAQRIAFTSPTFMQETPIIVGEIDSRRMITYLDIRDDYSYAKPRTVPTYKIKTFIVSDDPTKVCSEYPEAELVHEYNRDIILNDMVLDKLTIKELDVQKINIKDYYDSQSSEIEVHSLVMYQDEITTASRHYDPACFFGYTARDTVLGDSYGRVTLRSRDYKGQEGYNSSDIIHLRYPETYTDVNTFHQSYMLDTANFSRFYADSTGEYRFTVQRSKFLQNNYGTCYFNNEGKLYLYSYATDGKGKLGFNADGYLIVDGIENYYSKDEVYNKEEIDTTIGDIENDYNTKIINAKDELIERIDEKFNVLVPDSGGDAISKLDDRLKILEGKLDDIEIMLDKILGTETNTDSNETLEEILEG